MLEQIKKMVADNFGVEESKKYQPVCETLKKLNSNYQKGKYERKS